VKEKFVLLLAAKNARLTCREIIKKSTQNSWIFQSTKAVISTMMRIIALILAALLKTGFSEYLYVWTGASPSDLVAVVDYNQQSSTYGKIVKTVAVGSTGNEPHHSAISSNGNWFVAGGLLSSLNGLNDVYVFSVPEPGLSGPVLQRSINIPGGCTDAFVPNGGANFIVTQMCNDQAVSNGYVIQFNADTGNFSNYVDASGLQGFNPHGFGVFDDGSMFTADYIQPASLVATSNPADIVFRDTVRYFPRSSDPIQTFSLPPQASEIIVGSGNGFMDIGRIPKQVTQGRKLVYAAGNQDSKMYLCEPGKTPKFVLDFEEITGTKMLSACLFAFSNDGTRTLLSFQMRYIFLMDTSNPENPQVLQVYDFCQENQKIYPSQSTTFPQWCSANGNVVGTHFFIWPKNQNRFVVFNYFLNFGMATFAGTKTVHSFTFNRDFTRMTLDTTFNPNDQFFALGGSPHSGVYVPS
jgi:hypothetical protein